MHLRLRESDPARSTSTVCSPLAVARRRPQRLFLQNGGLPASSLSLSAPPPNSTARNHHSKGDLAHAHRRAVGRTQHERLCLRLQKDGRHAIHAARRYSASLAGMMAGLSRLVEAWRAPSDHSSAPLGAILQRRRTVVPDQSSSSGYTGFDSGMMLFLSTSRDRAFRMS